MAAKYNSRRELEDAWRDRLHRATARHQAASANSNKLVAERLKFPRIPFGPDGTLEVQQAHQQESDALRERIRVLRIFTDLIVDGIMPSEDPDSN